MSSELTTQDQAKKKKPLLKCWWLWVTLGLICVIVVGALATSSSESYDLANLSEMNKQEVIQKLGKPDESWIIRDEDDDYYYTYPSGVTIIGNAKYANEISLVQDTDKSNNNKQFNIVGMSLGSNISDYAEVLGNANIDLVSSEGSRSRMYHDVKEDIILNLLTDSDRIIGIRYVHYNKSDESYALDLANYIGNAVEEQQLVSELGIKSTVTGNVENTYYFGNSSMANWVKKDTQSGQVNEAVLSNGRFFNIGGLRIGDSIEEAKSRFGDPISSTDGVDDVRIDTFEYENINTFIVEVSSSNDEVGFIKLTSKSSYMKQLSEEFNDDEEVQPTSNSVTIDIWDTLDDNQKTEFNRFFSNFSEVNLGTDPYIKDSSISNYSADELIKFAIKHNQKFGQGNSYDIDPDDDEYLSMHEDLVTEVIDYYFGSKINHKAVSGYDYKNSKYLWSAYRWAYEDTNIFSQVKTLADNGDDTFTAEISIYQDSTPFDYFSSEDPDNVQAKSIRYKPKVNWADDSMFEYIGSAVAIIKKSESGDWKLLNYEITSMY
ncbi:hypothetical protein J2T12_000135 [Paenibacillus anaericanus]|uniref:hypothetical protein n=1 Tax=Paenibacillus anaericanus TaxID=170367 RepID=UPI0027828734|nr:hypothetical protein [Paenibacillus anaericanus]MDQ0086741.1 hypothetical protein [Paenibacillus anaericanus]